ncbi:MAG: thioredoxin domain-containing protein [Candidatus Saccharimonas sp.]|jgi:protein-disulfide isomerase
MDRKFLVIIAVIILGFAGLVIFQKNSEPPIDVIRSNNVTGKLDSKVTLTEYVDFQCEACAAFYPTVEAVKAEYKDRVKFQVKYFPLGGGHQYSRLTASYAEAAARQGKFFEMQDLLFPNQKVWETGNTQEYMDRYAKEIGLDMTKVSTDVKSSSVSATINADLKEVREMGGTGTPTFALNNNRIDNPDNTVEAFAKLLDDALAKAGQ